MFNDLWFLRGSRVCNKESFAAILSPCCFWCNLRKDNMKIAEVQYRFRSTKDTEVTLRKGDEVEVLSCPEDKRWWRVRTSDGIEGFAPASFIGELKDVCNTHKLKSMWSTSDISHDSSTSEFNAASNPAGHVALEAESHNEQDDGDDKPTLAKLSASFDKAVDKSLTWFKGILKDGPKTRKKDTGSSSGIDHTEKLKRWLKIAMTRSSQPVSEEAEVTWEGGYKFTDFSDHKDDDVVLAKVLAAKVSAGLITKEEAEHVKTMQMRAQLDCDDDDDIEIEADRATAEHPEGVFVDSAYSAFAHHLIESPPRSPSKQKFTADIPLTSHDIHVDSSDVSPDKMTDFTSMQRTRKTEALSPQQDRSIRDGIKGAQTTPRATAVSPPPDADDDWFQQQLVMQRQGLEQHYERVVERAVDQLRAKRMHVLATSPPHTRDEFHHVLEECRELRSRNEFLERRVKELEAIVANFERDPSGNHDNAYAHEATLDASACATDMLGGDSTTVPTGDIAGNARAQGIRDMQRSSNVRVRRKQLPPVLSKHTSGTTSGTLAAASAQPTTHDSHGRSNVSRQQLQNLPKPLAEDQQAQTRGVQLLCPQPTVPHEAEHAHSTPSSVPPHYPRADAAHVGPGNITGDTGTAALYDTPGLCPGSARAAVLTPITNTSSPVLPRTKAQDPVPVMPATPVAPERVPGDADTN